MLSEWSPSAFLFAVSNWKSARCVHEIDCCWFMYCMQSILKCWTFGTGPKEPALTFLGLCALGPSNVPVNPSQLKLAVFTVTWFGWFGHLPVIQKKCRILGEVSWNIEFCEEVRSHFHKMGKNS